MIGVTAWVLCAACVAPPEPGPEAREAPPAPEAVVVSARRGPEPEVGLLVAVNGPDGQPGPIAFTDEDGLAAVFVEPGSLLSVI
ncbi:MAG: hypothetical protein AAF211_23230, partial [Myxococcota bacterium]